MRVLVCLNGTKRDANVDKEKGQPKIDCNMQAMEEIAHDMECLSL